MQITNQINKFFEAYVSEPSQFSGPFQVAALFIVTRTMTLSAEVCAL